MSAQTHRQSRTRGLQLAALTSLVCKGGSILLQIVAIPMAYVVLGEESFGVFAMVSTLVTFVILSELGVGPGLTNLLTRSIAEGAEDRASTAFSTAFFLTAGLAALGCLLVIGAVLFLPITTLFGEKFSPFAGQMRSAIVLGIAIVFLKMVTSLGDRARAAYQETFITNLYGAIANLTAGTLLIVGIHWFPRIWFLILVVNGALAIAALCNMIHVWIRRPHLLPRIARFDPALASFLIRDGLAFCATLSLAPIAKDIGLRLILGHLGGPAAVAVFDILQRLMVFVFGFIVMFTFPLWPALSDAAARHDFEWIRTARRRLYTLAIGGGLLFTAGLAILGPWGIELWLRGELTLERTLFLSFGAYASIHIWHHVHHIFLAALDSIRLVSIAVLVELPCFLMAGYFGYRFYAFPGLFLSLALLGLVASVLFPHFALERMRTLERASTSPPMTDNRTLVTAVS